jgi:phage tail P2-like protein
MPDLLPPNATSLERALAGAAGRIDGLDVEVIRRLWDPASCSADLLPWLAWAASVDTWDDTWPEATRRRVIADSHATHRLKGTPAAIRLALQSIGLADVEIEEGLPPLVHDGEALRDSAHTYSGGSRWALFRLVADLGDEAGLDLAQIARVIAVVHRAKNVRSHLYSLAWRANVRVIGGPALLVPDLRAHLLLAARQGVRDGRYSRVPVPARLDRRGDVLADGSRTRADRHPAETLPYAVGHLRRRMPISAGLALDAARPTLLPRDGRIRATGAVRRGRPLATVAPLPVTTRRRPPRSGVFDRRGWGPARTGALTYAGGPPRGGRHIHGTLIDTRIWPEAA